MAEAFAWVNPHLTLSVEWDRERLHFPALAPDWTKWKASDPTCPHWYDQQRAERLIGAYVVNDREHGRDRTVREFMSNFRGLSGTAKQKAILEEVGMSRALLSSLCYKDGSETDRIAVLLAAMKAATRPARPEHLGLIGKDALAQRFERAGTNLETFSYAKELGVANGVPWVLECAFGWCPEAEKGRLITGVNWSPGISNPFGSVGVLYRNSLETILAEQRATSREPVIVVLHLA